MRVNSPSVLTATQQISNENGGLVNVTNVKTACLTTALGQCVPNQIVLVSSRLQLTKGATAGDSFHDVNQSSGTGTILFLNNLAFVEEKLIAHPIGLQWISVLTLIGIITAAGTVNLSTRGQSLGSDSACNAGDANHRIMVFRR